MYNLLRSVSFISHSHPSLDLVVEKHFDFSDSFIKNQTSTANPNSEVAKYFDFSNLWVYKTLAEVLHISASESKESD